MNIFFDTEFTGLHKYTTLISLGMVDENGRTFYAEFFDYDEDQVNDWIKENVIANLKFATNSFKIPDINFGSSDNIEMKANKKIVKEYLTKWLSAYDDVQFVSDVCHYDMVLLIDIFGGAFDLPCNINPACHDINQDIARYYNFSEIEAFDYSREKILENRYISIDGYKHNSLYDAKVIKAIYESICQL